ncbi:MAG TPA: hypothetical protein VKV15_25445 [Bryobacteraceae bacterium]|nr:hypothetical protein [Bryobacteraceae bacterium]
MSLLSEEEKALRGPAATSARRVFPRIVATVFFFAAFEGLFFHTSLYPSILEPDSTTGGMELELRDEIQRVKRDRNQVVAVGDSRMALLPRIANEMNTGYTFATVSLGGVPPRCWYYELRAIDPSAHEYSAILIPSGDYDEPDEYDKLGERELDLHYILARLELKDLFDFPWTYQSNRLKWVTFRGILLKGFVYKRDFEDFLLHSLDRFAKVRLYNETWAGSEYGYHGPADSLKGLRIDWQNKKVYYPDNITKAQRAFIEGTLFRQHPPDTGVQTAYYRYWYHRILNRYKGSRTKLIFLPEPRAPVPPPPHPPKLTSAVRQMASEPNAIVLDAHLFDSLERPDLFIDALHLNGPGTEEFSRILATEVRRVLGPPKP